MKYDEIVSKNWTCPIQGLLKDIKRWGTCPHHAIACGVPCPDKPSVLRPFFHGHLRVTSKLCIETLKCQFSIFGYHQIAIIIWWYGIEAWMFSKYDLIPYHDNVWMLFEDLQAIPHAFHHRKRQLLTFRSMETSPRTLDVSWPQPTIPILQEKKEQHVPWVSLVMFLDQWAVCAAEKSASCSTQKFSRPKVETLAGHIDVIGVDAPLERKWRAPVLGPKGGKKGGDVWLLGGEPHIHRICSTTHSYT